MKALIIVLCLLCFNLTVSARGDVVAFYLVKDLGQKDELAGVSLTTLPLDKEPLIGSDDILSYSLSTHSMLLTKTAFDKFNEVPVGEVFAVCVDGKPVYIGKVWSDLLSSSCSDVILLYRHSAAAENRLNLELGYPTRTYFTGKDPRSDDSVLKALRVVGKLKQ